MYRDVIRPYHFTSDLCLKLRTTITHKITSSAQHSGAEVVSPCWCRQPGQSDLASGFDSRSKGKEFAIPNAQECVREDAGRYRAEAMASRLSHFEAAARRKAVGIGEVRVVG